MRSSFTRPTACLGTLFFLLLALQAAADDCLQCHTDIAQKMRGNSHHVQGTVTTSKHCYACHWEATPDGEINEKYHQRDLGRIDLVIWGQGARPTSYIPESTAISFSSAAIGKEGERTEIAKITRHCLACHCDSNNNTSPFIDDSNTPLKYAWDGQSIASRYEQKGVTSWGKYSTAFSNKKKQLTKALSAHGNAGANEGGWSKSSGYDSKIPIDRGGSSSKNIECYDCHNSHGSNITGVTTSYRSYEGTSSGGLLKQTISGKNGYQMTYTPSSNTDLQSKNPYNPGAGLCFDCHETESSGITPWGYSSTFAASQPVMGYKDTHRFGPGVKGSTSRFASRQGRSEIVSSHLKAEIFLKYSATENIKGLCTPCHDPHGVSPTLGNKMAYAVPLLKGTWLTSPYREDAPPANAPGKGGPSMQGSAVAAGATGTTKGPVSMQGMHYNIDRNTFPADGKLVENADTFAGLCLKCHKRLNSEGNSKTARIHKAVKGWGENREHSFPCSKCHQAHNSGLPRLLQTNCFEEGPAGLRDDIGLSWLPEKKGIVGAKKASSRISKSTAPDTAKNRSAKADFVGCHVRQFGRSGSSAPKKDGVDWIEKTPW